MKTENEMIELVKSTGFLPLFYHQDPQISVDIIKALYTAGVRCVEYTNRGASALNNFKIILENRAKHYPDLVLAIGTIHTQKEAQAFIDAGADFLISPFFDQSIADTAYLHKKLWIPGCMTPTEIHIAETAGCQLVKLFPGNVLGPGFVAAIKPLFPSMDFIVTGGVDTTKENLAAWFKAGVVGVGLGSQLFTQQIMDTKNYELLATETKKLIGLVQAFKK
ncbi:MAG: bifunctional 4-hydroxy-2-oxoglutarate aldolase/2-dehydro-3-deoxy-phosphogluconate aldolase [Bacteroidetes bacterium]|nr:bifunctional 4-hydroxy-2-oxoglutarate aldolase/2-dehydro-3-deoxy-phosphogluconate aldolase [Bacteroidota bacterium]